MRVYQQVLVVSLWIIIGALVLWGFNAFGLLSKTYRNVHITREELKAILERGISIKGYVFMTPGISSNRNYSVKLFPTDLPLEPVINPFLLRRPLASKKLQIPAQFNIEGLPKERYILCVVGNNISATGIEVDATLGSQEVIVFVNRMSSVLRGRVLWADTKEPVVGALVSRSWYPWELEIYDLPSMVLHRFEVETDEKGAFKFSNLSQGRYILQISYVDVSFERSSGSRKKNIIRKRIELPVCGKSYVFYLGRKDGKSFKSK